MNLYIDKENIESFISNRSNELYPDCIKTMQKQLNVFFNFKKDILKGNEGLMAWFKLFTSGMGKDNKIEFKDTAFPDRPLKSNSYNSFDITQLSSFYLINDDRINVLKDKGAVLIGSPGEEFDIFNKIFFLQNDYQFEKKLKIGGPEFKGWTDLNNLSTSLTDIIFIDPFIISDKTLVEINIIPYLKTLVLNAKCKVNIVLYTNIENVNLPYSDLSPMIRQAIENVIGIKPNFTLVRYRDQRGVKSYAEHDRTICTNYFRVYSGDSFNYFKANGEKITKGREIHYSSFGNKENHDLAFQLIADLQNNLNELPTESVEGDKISNYLKFK